MKKIIFTCLVLLCAFRVVAQTSAYVKHYQASVEYTTLSGPNGQIDSTTPKGGAVFIDYDTYYKTITIAYEDVNGKQHHLALTYNSGSDVWTMMDNHDRTYWVTPGNIAEGHLEVQLLENGSVVSVLNIEGITARGKATY